MEKNSDLQEISTVHIYYIALQRFELLLNLVSKIMIAYQGQPGVRNMSD